MACCRVAQGPLFVPALWVGDVPSHEFEPWGVMSFFGRPSTLFATMLFQKLDGPPVERCKSWKSRSQGGERPGGGERES